MLYQDLKWTEVLQSLEENLLIIPVGAIEQHGPHLPLGVDMYLAKVLANEIGKHIPSIIAPVISYGARSLPNSGGGDSFPGTILISGKLLISLYKNIITSYLRAGSKRIFILNGHWENYPFIIEAIEELKMEGEAQIAQILGASWWDIISHKEMQDIFGEFSGWHAEHAGQAETSLMLYYFPNLVNMKNAVDFNKEIPPNIYKHPTPEDWTGNNGVLSNSRQASRNKGEQLANIIISNLVAFLGENEHIE
jgi:creatinine amidohydrolase